MAHEVILHDALKFATLRATHGQGLVMWVGNVRKIGSVTERPIHCFHLNSPLSAANPRRELPLSGIKCLAAARN